ncbi:hypothetical protein CYMTET_16511 [Cymbomonas tetramitiformis]|uniref:Photosynthesis system II assembly factor Ycf48/Hcf136-like domain-containing protein n=1 Tax=Cymbomonas tetramitiformis TaxID=36881 RepID=A0AAE0GC01_9CHLO|nr:hypothetical protein CYMTET_16511 [Cymbomonas tetramitiformis]
MAGAAFNLCSAWAVGDDDTLLFTHDGGSNWNATSSGIDLQCLTSSDCASYRWESASFFDASIGWVVGNHGMVLYTSDGGATWGRQWLPVATPPDITLRAVQTVGSAGRDVFSVGDQGVIVRTSDGGLNWRAQESPVSGDLSAISFIDSRRGWVSGDLGNRVLHTTDGGLSWGVQQVPELSGAVVLGSYFEPVRGIGWLAGTNGTVVMTSDAGFSWRRLATCTMADLRAVRVDVTTRYGFAAGREGAICFSEDAGFNWRNDLSIPEDARGCPSQAERGRNEPPMLPRFAFALPPPDARKHVHTPAAAAERLADAADSLAPRTWLSVLAGASVWLGGSMRMGLPRGPRGGIVEGGVGGLRSLLQGGLGLGWAGGVCEGKGRWGVLRPEGGMGGGPSGNAEEGLTANSLHDIALVGLQRGWAVGELDTILITRDGGETWESVSTTLDRPCTSCARYSWYGVGFYDNMIGWIVGSFGTVVSTRDGGDTWQLQPSPAAYTVVLRAVQALSSDVAVAVGDRGTIISTNDGGAQWRV